MNTFFHFIVVIILASAIFYAGYTYREVLDDKPPAIQKPETDYCKSLFIGAKFEICSYNYKDGNPFDDKTKGIVVITDMQRGYVQYTWGHQRLVKFSRTCEEFVELINNCK